MFSYRKKPVVVQAFRVKFGGTEEVQNIPDWFRKAFESEQVEYRSVPSPYYVVHTQEGSMMALEGDWIIQGVEGEIYPCKNSIFEATYEAVTE